MKKSDKTITFQNVSTDKVASIIKKLNTKAASKYVMPTKIIKNLEHFLLNFFQKNFNSCLETGSFSEDLKYAEVVPIYKKNDKKYKSNDKRNSLLCNISKVYERCIQEQLDKYYSGILSKYWCGFKEGYETENCLNCLAVLIDLSKAFDCIPHNLFIAKLLKVLIGNH